MDDLARFEVAFQDKKAPKHACFYPNPPTYHFFQINNYFDPMLHPKLTMLAFVTYDNWSQYNTAYRYAYIYGHEVLEKQNTDVGNCTFKLQVIDVSCSDGKHYIGVLKISDELKTCFSLDNMLQISFDLKHNTRDQE